MTRSDITALVVSGMADSGEVLAKFVADTDDTISFIYNLASDRIDVLLENLPGGDSDASQG